MVITIISAFTGILLAFHRALKVDANFKAFRYGESEFYDTYRRMMDRPESFGATEDTKLPISMPSRTCVNTLEMPK